MTRHRLDSASAYTGVPVRVLSLDRLIQLKRELERPKDIAMLPVLEATLRERDRR